MTEGHVFPRVRRAVWGPSARISCLLLLRMLCVRFADVMRWLKSAERNSVSFWVHIIGTWFTNANYRHLGHIHGEACPRGKMHILSSMTLHKLNRLIICIDRDIFIIRTVLLFTADAWTQESSKRLRGVGVICFSQHCWQPFERFIRLHVSFWRANPPPASLFSPNWVMAGRQS